MENPFLIGNDNAIFSQHPDFGFVVHNGDFVGREGFVEREGTIKALRRYNPNQRFILNMGDSSTSGWHSDYVSRKGENTPTSPFFHYKTYSDLMRETFPFAVNAGVSKFSSFQGVKYLAFLLREFARAGLYPSYVTLYFGNNDGVYSQIEDKAAIDFMQPTKEKTFQRVLPQDFENNFSDMIRLTRAYGATPVVIIPIRRYDWPPGLRSSKHAGEYEAGLEQLRPEELRAELTEARRLYLAGDLNKAYEKDLFLPRLKRAHYESLRRVVRKNRAKVIDVQRAIPFRNAQDFFCDYCHPLEPANRLIVKEFLDILREDRRPRGILTRLVKSSSQDDIYPLW